MSWDVIERWLTTSLLGLVLLSAGGSVVAWAFLRLTRTVVYRWAPALAKRLKDRANRLAYSHGFVVGAMFGGHRQMELQVYIAYRQMSFALALFLTALFLGVFAYVIPSAGRPVLQVPTFASLTLSMLSFRWALREVRFMRYAYLRSCGEMLDAAGEATGSNGHDEEEGAVDGVSDARRAAV